MNNVKITLLSDTCISFGENFSSSIDTDICYDNFGLPYIPARRIKGYLREAAEYFADWEIIGKDVVYGIFGKSGMDRSCLLQIGDALILNHDDYVREIENAPQNEKIFYQKNNIIDCFSYVRAQTAVENGTAKDNSLRFTRVLKKGLEFVFSYTLDSKFTPAPNAYKAAFNNFLKAVNHIGMNSNRGFGHVKLEEIDIAEANEKNEITINENDENLCELVYTLKLESPIIVPMMNGGDKKTVTFIPGTSMKGFVSGRFAAKNFSKNSDGTNKTVAEKTEFEKEFERLFLSGALIFKNAYIEIGGERGFVIPSSINKVKDSDIYENGVLQKLADVNFEGVQTSDLSEGYISELTGENAVLASVKTELFTHHTYRGDGQDGELYSFSAISKNQTFVGGIVGKAKDLKKIIPFLKEGQIVRIGKSKNSQYGRCRLENIAVKRIVKAKNAADKFAVMLNSDTYFINENLVFAAEIELLETALAQKLGVKNGKITRESLSLRHTAVGGYNSKWNLQKYAVPAFKAGTICAFSCDEEVDLSLIDGEFIGERNYDGFGEIIAFPFDKLKSKISVLKNKNRQNNEDLTDENKAFLKTQICKKLAKTEIQKFAFRRAEKVSINASTIGKVALMVNTLDNAKTFLDEIGSLKNDGKSEKVFVFLYGEKTAVKLEEFFVEITANDVVKNSKLTLDQINKIYTIALLNQAKYLLRKQKKEA